MVLNFFPSCWCSCFRLTLILSLLLFFLAPGLSGRSGAGCLFLSSLLMLTAGFTSWPGPASVASSSSWLWYSELRYRPFARLVRFVPKEIATVNLLYYICIHVYINICIPYIYTARLHALFISSLQK